MYAVAELDPCPFEELCEEYHPELDKHREGCSCENCDNCGIYWAYRGGYADLDEN